MAQRERAAEYAARNFRWNCATLLLDSSSFWAGMAFIETSTVLPVLLGRLHASDTVIGASRFLQVLGFTLPAVLGAHYIHGRTRHKPFLLASCAVGRAGLFTLPFLFLTSASSNATIALAWFLGVYGLFWMTDGACAVSWMDMIGKTIPHRVRGRFFGAMQTLSGLAAVAAGFGVKVVLQKWGYPLNFALLAAGMSGGSLLSLLFLSLIREPDGVDLETPKSEMPGFREFIVQSGPLLRANRRLGQILIVRILLDGASMALPFYVLYAERDLGVGLQAVAVFAILQSIGRVSGGPVWGWVSDHAGAITGVRLMALCAFSVPALGIIAALGHPAAMYVAFVMMGVSQDGIWMAGLNALLASVTERERPLAIGISSMLQSPGALFNLAGGIVAGSFGYPSVFGFALIFAAAALLLAIRIGHEPFTMGESDQAA